METAQNTFNTTEDPLNENEEQERTTVLYYNAIGHYPTNKTHS